jgi:hypothetical protein
MRQSYLLILGIFLTNCFTACTLEERANDSYSMEYNCGENQVTMFNLDGERHIFAGRDELNRVFVNDTSVHLQTTYQSANRAFRLDLIYYMEDAMTQCSGIKAEANFVEAYIDEDGKVRNRLYPLDCGANPVFNLRSFDPENQTACGNFSFTVRIGHFSYALTNGYFDL